MTDIGLERESHPNLTAIGTMYSVSVGSTYTLAVRSIWYGRSLPTPEAPENDSFKATKEKNTTKEKLAVEDGTN